MTGLSAGILANILLCQQAVLVLIKHGKAVSQNISQAGQSRISVSIQGTRSTLHIQHCQAELIRQRFVSIVTCAMHDEQHACQCRAIVACTLCAQCMPTVQA